MRIYIVILIAALALMAASCGKMKSGFGILITNAPPVEVKVTSAFDKPLIVYEKYAVGTITVENDDTRLYVTYDVFGDWELEETYTHASRWLNAIPQTWDRELEPNRFYYVRHHDSGTKSRTYVFPLAELRAIRGDTVYIAAKALVRRDGEECEAWGGLHRFPGETEAAYVEYQIGTPALTRNYYPHQQYITTERQSPKPYNTRQRDRQKPWRSPEPFPWQRCN